MQQLTREQIISLCQSQPEVVADAFLALTAQVAELQARVKRFEDRLAQDSHNSHRPPSGDTFKRPRTKSLRKATGKKAGGQTGHPGTTLRLVENPDQTIVHPVKFCQHCQQALETVTAVDYEKRQVFDLPPLRLEVTEHQAEIKTCVVCHQQTRADFPADITHVAQYGSRFKGWAVYLNTHQLLPYDRTAEVFADVFAHPVSPGTLVNFNQECFTALASHDETVKAKLLASEVANFDETGVNINGQLHWLHVAATPELTYYACHAKRGQEAMDAIGILPNFHGTAVHDYLAAYQRYDCDHALCNAHHLRELTFISEQDQQDWAPQMIDLLLDTKQKVANNAFRLNAATLREIKQKYRRLVKKGFAENPLAAAEALPKKRGRRQKSKSRNLVERFASCAKEILAFAEDFNVPFDNNQAERDLRMMKVQQKISGCFRSFTGAKVFCRIRGYISTNRKQGCNVLEALQNVFNHKILLCPA